METLSRHSNQSAYATAIKNNVLVETNAMNISAKFKLHPPYSFWGVDFLNIFRKLGLLVAITIIWTKSICLVKDHSTNISKKNLQNICNEIAINTIFSHYKPMEIKIAIAT